MPDPAIILCPFLTITRKSTYHHHLPENNKSSWYLFFQLYLFASMRHKKMSNICNIHIFYLAYTYTASPISLLYCICILLTCCSINITHSISKTLIQGYYKELEVAFKCFFSTGNSTFYIRTLTK